MKNNISPGTDGFSSDFFQVFWRKIGTFLMQSVNYNYKTGELSLIQRLGIITLIPKENKSKQNLTNYRQYVA